MGRTVDLPTLKTRQEKLIRRATNQELQIKAKLVAARIPFEFQAIIPPYIVDFVIPDKMLILELDGILHQTYYAKQYDAKRTRYLQKLGFAVIRIPNSDAKYWSASAINLCDDSTLYQLAVEKAHLRIAEPKVIKAAAEIEYRPCHLCGKPLQVKRSGKMQSHKTTGRFWCRGAGLTRKQARYNALRRVKKALGIRGRC